MCHTRFVTLSRLPFDHCILLLLAIMVSRLISPGRKVTRHISLVVSITHARPIAIVFTQLFPLNIGEFACSSHSGETESRLQGCQQHGIDHCFLGYYGNVSVIACSRQYDQACQLFLYVNLFNEFPTVWKLSTCSKKDFGTSSEAVFHKLTLDALSLPLTIHQWSLL